MLRNSEISLILKNPDQLSLIIITDFIFLSFMGQVLDFFRKLFDTSDFPPRWHCGRWSDFHGWLYIISDLSIWAAYFAIPLIIVKFISRRTDARFIRIYFLFAAFILACGSTHLLDALTFWYPFYRFNAVVRFLTAVISWVTVFSLIKILPVASSLKTAGQLESEIEQRKNIEEQLKINNGLLTEAQDIARLGHWQWDIPTNKVTWSDSTLKIFGLTGDKREMTYEEYLQRIHPEERQQVSEHISKSLEEKVNTPFYHRTILPDGTVRLLLGKGEVITDKNGNPVRMVGTVQDITDQKNFEQELLLKTQKLEASNVELQKFAFVASHDLREPLRKIITFGSMLEKDCKDALGEKGNMYLQKMTGASLRMQKLIDDILDFSKLTVNTREFRKVRLNDIIANVLSDMEVAVTKSNAKVNVDPLPELEGNASQLGQLFQNLISNAIKFRSPDQQPEIHISSRLIGENELPEDFLGGSHYHRTSDKSYCEISVTDNGIGFDESYLDKIFLIFQRLHGHTEYEGTGVGLAICKKVVDLHNGYITATSRQGAGAKFVIILPLKQQHHE
jgi:PAS domain S-box-containing protein